MLKLINISYEVEVEEKGKKHKKSILKNINLNLNENKMITITGSNGSGKSTLAKIIMGIIKPTSGKIYLDGEDITDLSITERANKGIAFAFQQPVRFKGITVSDLVSMASGKKLTVTEVCSYLSEVGLCAREYVNREINSSLSGGELKRIEIASTMARGAKFTVFDEPEAGIDLWSFNSLIKVFERLSEKTNGSLLIISHQERILNIADRIIVIEGGKIKADGTREEILPNILAGKACSALTQKAVK